MGSLWSEQGIHGLEHRLGGGHRHSGSTALGQASQGDQLETVFSQGGSNRVEGGPPASGTEVHQGSAPYLQLRVLQQGHELLPPALLGRELQQGTTSSAANQRPFMLHKRFNHRQHVGVGHTDLTESLKQGFTGFHEAGGSRLLGSSHGRTTGQAPTQRLNGGLGPQIAQCPCGDLAQTVIVVLQGGEQIIDGGPGGSAEPAEGTGSIAGHGIGLDTGPRITGATLPQGQDQQRNRVGMGAAMTTQPPGRVVLSGGVIRETKPPQGLLLADRISVGGTLLVDIAGGHHGETLRNGLLLAPMLPLAAPRRRHRAGDQQQNALRHLRTQPEASHKKAPLAGGSLTSHQDGSETLRPQLSRQIDQTREAIA